MRDARPNALHLKSDRTRHSLHLIWISIDDTCGAITGQRLDQGFDNLPIRDQGYPSDCNHNDTMKHRALACAEYVCTAFSHSIWSSSTHQQIGQARYTRRYTWLSETISSENMRFHIGMGADQSCCQRVVNIVSEKGCCEKRNLISGSRLWLLMVLARFPRCWMR